MQAMTRIALVALSVFLAFQGMAFGQGLIESIGNSLSGWNQPGGNLLNAFTNPRFFGGSYDPARMQFRTQGPVAQQSAVGYGNTYNYAPPATRGIYPQWQSGQPAPPPVTYRQPQPPPRRQSSRPLRANVPGPQAQPPGPRDVEQLPPGAIQITTTTPQGTVVQYYPPPGEQASPQPYTYRSRRPRMRPAAAPSKRRSRTKKPAIARESPQPAGIAAPKPVEIPSGADPRSGWSVR